MLEGWLDLTARVEELFHELEFRSLVNRLPATLGEAPAAAPSRPAKAAEPPVARAYRTIRSEKDLKALAKDAKAAGRIALHVENTDANGMRGVLVGIAIAAATARAEFQIERVLIVDFDVHHGNGTQDIFYRDPAVFYFSVHQWPLFP